jgi:hypothetical protein
MRPIPPVRKQRCPSVAKVLLAIAGAIVALGAGNGQPPVIDLTKSPPDRTEAAAAPGYSTRVPTYVLPLTLLVERVRSTAAGELTVDLLLRNTGSTDFELPASQDSSRILQNGNKGRSTFIFRMRTVGTRPEQVISSAVGSLSGSSSVPNSFLRLKPNAAVRILLKADIDFLEQWKTQGTTVAEVQLICSEWKLDDDRFYISATSRDLKSENVVKIP